MTIAKRTFSKADFNPILRIAANNSSTRARRQADYVCSGTGDHVVLNSFLATLKGLGGGELMIEEGVYDIADTVLIDSSNIRLRGRSRDTKFNVPWVRATPLDYPIKAQGLIGEYINNISVSDLSLIGNANWSENGTDPDGCIGVLYNDCYFQYINNLWLNNIHMERGAFTADIRTCTNIHAHQLSGYQSSGPIAIVSSDGVTIEDIEGHDVKLLVDLGIVSNAVISNVRGAATSATSGDHVKGIDGGGCSNIVLSNFILKDFDNGLNIKYETAFSKGWNVSNGRIIGSDNPIRVDRVGQTTGAKMGPAELDNITVVGGIIGINLLGYSEGISVSNCRVTADSGINAIGADNVTIQNCDVVGTAGFGIRAGKLGSTLECENVKLLGNTIAAYDAAHGGGNSAIYLSECIGPEVVGNTITHSDYHGIWAAQCKDLTICDNRIQHAWGNAINLQWTNTTYTDATARALDFKCNRNRIKGWFNNGVSGLVGATKGINLDLTGISGAAYNYGELVGNQLAGTGIELGIDVNSPVDLDYLMITGNNLRNLSTHKIYRRGTGVFGANTQIRNNTGHITENSGVATVASGSTTIVVSHGLASNTNTAPPTAKDIIVTPTNDLGSATKFWVSAVTATTFTISVDTAPGGSGATFAWQAQKLFGV